MRGSETEAGAPEEHEAPAAANADDALPRRRVLEALLFASDAPVSVERLRTALGAGDRGEVRTLIEELRSEYEETGRAFQIEEIAAGYLLLTRPEFEEHVARLRGPKEEVKLSPAALEALAVIAYRQPILRADVEKVRGVGCGPVLRSLMEYGLVRVAGRADLPGSPLLYGTTTRFLEELGLKSLRELPKPADF